MYKTLFLLFFSGISILSFGQKTPTSKYIGMIKVDGVGTFAYQVNLDINGTQVSGNTITTTGPGKDTEASLSGTVLQDRHQITFAENKIIATDFKDKKIPFCFVNTTLSKKTRGKMETLEGKFIGKDENGAKCATGQIYLTRKSAIMADSVDLSRAFRKLADTVAKIKKEQNAVTELSVNELNKVSCKGQKIRVSFYDGSYEDEDAIGISYNSTQLTEKHVLMNKPKNFDLKIEKGADNIIIVKTLNIGLSGLNTVNIDIEVEPNKIKTYRFEAEAQKSVRIQLLN